MQLARWWSLNNAENSSDFAFLGKMRGANREVDEVGQRESVTVKFIDTANCVGDVLTKALGRTAFERHARRLLGEAWVFPDRTDLCDAADL